MADYWKSQAKKFCDFCKCWIADNKPSIGFHESGKRHKENVAKRLSEITKKSAKSYKEELQVDQEMKKMEEEAMKAYMKDLQENPDYTSKRILEDTERRKRELEESVRQQRQGQELQKPEEETQSSKPDVPQTIPLASTSKIWYEAKSDEGYTYYWNTNTSESRWELPEEGFISIEEQNKLQKETELGGALKKRTKKEKTKQKDILEEGIKDSNKKQKTKKNKTNDEEERRKEDEVCSAVGPAPKPDPYGAWKVIEPKVEQLDLELPQQDYIVIKVPELVEPEVKFKEKTFSTLEDEGFGFGTIKNENDSNTSASFKKRKVNRGNMRQKLDTD